MSVGMPFHSEKRASDTAHIKIWTLQYIGLVVVALSQRMVVPHLH